MGDIEWEKKNERHRMGEIEWEKNNGRNRMRATEWGRQSARVRPVQFSSVYFSLVQIRLSHDRVAVGWNEYENVNVIKVIKLD